jgi:hypothetical protein
MKKLSLVLLMVALVGFCFTPAWAQENELNEEEFGLMNQVTWLNSYDFESALDFGIVVDLNEYGYYNFVERFSLTPPGHWIAPIHLPDNTRLVRATLYGYDSSTPFGIIFNVLKYNQNTRITTPQIVGGGPLESLGNGGYFQLPAQINKNIDNTNQVYYAFVNTNTAAGFDGVTLGDHRHRYSGVKLLWYRQISTPPASHTFQDVFPGDWYYSAVEALVASGITVGCDAHNFCPNDSITRAEVAAFLARALGL